jgi:hypothetical protein
MYRASFSIVYYDQQMYNYFTNYHTPTCFDILRALVISTLSSYTSTSNAVVEILVLLGKVLIINTLRNTR